MERCPNYGEELDELTCAFCDGEQCEECNWTGLEFYCPHCDAYFSPADL